MKLKTRFSLLALMLAIAFTGCTSTPAPPDSSDTHPANAHAASGALPPLAPMLMSATNLVLVKPVTEPAPEHQHGHEKHGMKPPSEETK